MTQRIRLLHPQSDLRKVFDRLRSPMVSQERVLRQLMTQAEHTAFGRHYRFGALLRSPNLIAEFQKTVALYHYDALFDAWWHRTLAGEANICWPDVVRHFALSSGTSGASSKYIPITPDMTASMRSAALRMFSCLPKYQLPPNFYTKDWLMVGSSSSLTQMETGAFAGDLSGINAKQPPRWMRRFIKPGPDVARLKTWEERVKIISERAPKWDISVVSGIPSWVQLTLERIVADHGLDTIHDLWPNLQIFVSGGIAFEPYRKSFERLLAKPLIYQDSYLASEGFIAFQSRPGTHAMRLLLNNGIFFEFIPFNDDNFDDNGLPRPLAQVLTLDKVTTGVDYALLITTNAGAWRYLIGDTVRFTDLARSEIIITGRTKHFLSLCGEHLSVDNMNHAIQDIAQEMDIAIPEFTVGGVQEGTHFAHHWYIGCDHPETVDQQALATRLDAALKRYNDDYAAERSAMMRPPKVTLLPTQAFYDWQKDHGKFNGQSKIPRVLKGERWVQWCAFQAQSAVL